MSNENGPQDESADDLFEGKGDDSNETAGDQGTASDRGRTSGGGRGRDGSMDRAHELDEREDKLDQREEGLDQRAEKLKRRSNELDEREEELREERQEIEDVRAELENRRAQIEQREEELDDREVAIRERENELSERATELNEKEETLHEYVGDHIDEHLANVESAINNTVRESVTQSMREMDLDPGEAQIDQASVNKTIKDSIESTMEGYGQKKGRFGTIGNLLLGLAGITFIAAGITNGFATEVSSIPVLFSSSAANFGASAILIFTGLAVNLAAAAGRI